MFARFRLRPAAACSLSMLLLAAGAPCTYAFAADAGWTESASAANPAVLPAASDRRA